jgi:hypothetical protein
VIEKRGVKEGRWEWYERKSVGKGVESLLMGCSDLVSVRSENLERGEKVEDGWKSEEVGRKKEKKWKI